MKEKLNENIVKVLMNEKNYLTAETIAKKLNVGEKTVRRRISQINEGMLEEIGRIVSKKGQGYKLEIESKEEFVKYYDYVIAEAQINNPLNRRTAIFEHLMNHKYSSKVDLLNQYYISEVTLTSDINALNEYSKEHNVLIKTSKKGYFVTGDEYHIRNTLLKLIYDSGAVRVRRRKTRIIKNSFVSALRNLFNEEGYYVNKHTLDAIINYLLISIGNISKGRMLAVTNIKEYQKIGKEFTLLAHKIHNLASIKMNTIFPLTETIFFTYFLKSVMPLEVIDTSTMSFEFYEKPTFYTKKTIDIMKGLGLRDISEDCSRDIYEFLYCFLIRVDLDIQKKEMIYLSIEKTHSQSYWISKIIFEQFGKLLNVKISKEEIAYFAMIIVHYFFSPAKQKKYILAILPSDYFIARVYTNELRHIAEYDIDFVSYQEFMKMSEIDENKYSVLINPYDYLPTKTRVKTYTIFDVVSRNDIINILRILSYKDYTNLIENLKKIKKVHYQGDFCQVEKELMKDKGYATTIFGSYIGIQMLHENSAIEYSIYEHEYMNKFVILINAHLSANEIHDLLKIAVDVVLKLNSNNEIITKENLFDYYS